MARIPRNIQIIETVFDPLQAMRDYQRTELENATNFGATASFIGTMRDFNEDDSVSAMQLEHYPAMTEKQLNQIVDIASDHWLIKHVLIVHRVGKIKPGEPIMLVAVWSVHRAAAFDACRFLMEELKHRAPFWKKEQLGSGDSRWVEKNTDGYG